MLGLDAHETTSSRGVTTHEALATTSEYITATTILSLNLGVGDLGVGVPQENCEFKSVL